MLLFGCGCVVLVVVFIFVSLLLSHCYDCWCLLFVLAVVVGCDGVTVFMVIVCCFLKVVL